MFALGAVFSPDAYDDVVRRVAGALHRDERACHRLGQRTTARMRADGIRVAVDHQHRRMDALAQANAGRSTDPRLALSAVAIR